MRSIALPLGNLDLASRFSIIVLLMSIAVGEDSSKIKQKDPKKAFAFSLIPGMGQVYNGKWIKSALVIGLEVSSYISWQDNANKYKEYDQNNHPLSRHRYMEKRNKYAWWIGIIYFYAMIDAVVDSHLHSFSNLMEEPINKENNKEIKYAE